MVEKPIYRFGPFEADPTRRQLLRDGEPVPMTAKVFDLLLLLVENQGSMVDKETLLSTLWPGTIVEEKNLTVNMSSLRKALGESPQDRRYIVTSSGRGYSFVADVDIVHPKPKQLEREVVIEDRVTTSVTIAHPPRQFGVKHAGLALLLVASLLAAGWFARGRQTQTAPRSIAILPFKPLPGDVVEPHLQLGIADALINRLGRMPNVIVRPLTAVRRFAGADPMAAAATLQAESVLDGSIQQAGPRVKVTAQLFAAPSGKMLWSEQFESDITDPFTLEDAISTRLGQTIAPNLDAGGKSRLARHDTENREAYMAYEQGRFEFLTFTQASLIKSFGLFERAAQLDPAFSLPQAGLADAYLWYAGDYGAPNEYLPKAEAAARRALELDSDAPGLHATIATVLYRYHYDWKGAEREFKLSIAQNPNDALSHNKYGWFLGLEKRTDESAAEMDLAYKLAPYSPLMQCERGFPLFCAGRLDEAIAFTQPVIASYPKFATAYMDRGIGLSAKGKLEEALASFQAVPALDNSTEAQLQIAYCHARLGRREKALEILKKLEGWSTYRYVPKASVAMVQMALGDRNAALDLLEQGVADHSWWITFLRIDPRFNELRTEPRFMQILQRVGL